MDLESGIAQFEAEVESIRTAATTLAVAYAESVRAVNHLASHCAPTSEAFADKARILNAEAVRRGQPPVVTAPDVGAEFDMALLLHGVSMPPPVSFTATSGGGAADE